MKYMQKKSDRGFTVIEIMIVLAIAGIILLIVFLAVPALQRNSRNTQGRNDVQIYMGAVTEWSTNNNGKIPSSNGEIAAVNLLANTSFMTEPTTNSGFTGSDNATPGLGIMRYHAGGKCNAGDAEAGSPRAFVVRFSVEDSTGSPVEQCQAS